jgi:ABC-type iron transport system FetAB permease component
MIFSLVPLFGILYVIYGLVLIKIGISKIHALSEGKSIAAVLLPALITLILIIGFMLTYIFIFPLSFNQS